MRREVIEPATRAIRNKTVIPPGRIPSVQKAECKQHIARLAAIKPVAGIGVQHSVDNDRAGPVNCSATCSNAVYRFKFSIRVIGP